MLKDDEVEMLAAQYIAEGMTDDLAIARQVAERNVSKRRRRKPSNAAPAAAPKAAPETAAPSSSAHSASTPAAKGATTRKSSGRKATAVLSKTEQPVTGAPAEAATEEQPKTEPEPATEQRPSDQGDCGVNDHEIGPERPAAKPSRDSKHDRWKVVVHALTGGRTAP